MLARTSLSDAVHFHTSESVTEGHPDKICDQIADAILDDILAVDPYGRVACEVVATTGLVFIFGEITTTRRVDYEGIARRTIREIGYTRPEYAFDADSCGIIVSVKEQSSDIASAVDVSMEVRRGQEEAEGLEIGAGDQGHMIGFACIETPTFMPLPIHLAHRLTRQLARARKEGILPFLRPDGKSQVTIEYTNGTARRIAAIVISAQHDPDVADEKLRQGILEQVIRPMIPANLLDEMTAVHINPSGRFVIGGPAGDSGLTGRKNIVDTYGSNARHGGGSYSGKDPTKVDRSGSYAARYVAKNIVAAGLADRLEVELAYAIGVAQPLSIAVETFGTEHVPKEMILKLIRQHFDLRPGAIIRDLALRRPIYRPTAAYGHFGRDDIDAPWEHTDRASAIRQAAGL